MTDQEIVVNDTIVEIHVLNDQIKVITFYWIQVAAVNVIGQGPVRETILCEAFSLYSSVRFLLVIDNLP